MFNLRITSSEGRITATASVEDTVRKVLDEKGISREGAITSLNGYTLTETDINSSTFAQLGVSEGATALLSVIVKADSAK